ncbi:MAG: RagB/SusD family nutrient uptake outer membrane protein [Chitinophagaceae bacterium]|nr:RagB/SusD family nutrient uptake outer membrane protein [Chitinophagaceae bacterium]
MKRYFTIIITVLLLASCNKWFDIKPEDQVTKDELFKSESGFMEALNGVYTSCANADLYGLELSSGLPEVLAQNYHFEPNDRDGYKQSSLYNYTDLHFIDMKDKVWRKMYTAIANCNLILENIDNPVYMTDVNRRLIHGEALALRAYLHLDLLRLFAPSYASAPAAKAIPYVTTFSNKATALSTVTEALNKMVTDLTEAKALMKPVDPIIASAYVVGYPSDTASKELKAPVLFQQNRRHRMNYYAVCGTLARVYLCLDKKQEALANAKEVIEAGKFPWTKEQDFINADVKLKDRILYPELVFCWFDNWNTQVTSRRFESGFAGFYIKADAGDKLYEKGGVGGEDRRFKQWFNLINDAAMVRYELLKYEREKETNRHPFVHPAIRLSELYYIAAESSWDTDPAKALEYLNLVRAARGINVAINTSSKTVFMDELVKEVRKETYAEGQLFYLYKRLKRGILMETGATTPPSNKIFVLPFPNDELEYGQH